MRRVLRTCLRPAQAPLALKGLDIRASHTEAAERINGSAQARFSRLGVAFQRRPASLNQTRWIGNPWGVSTHSLLVKSES